MLGLIGCISTTDVFICPELPENMIIFTGLPEHVGEFNFFKTIAIESNHQPNTLRYQWIAWEHVAAVAKDPAAIAVVKIKDNENSMA